MFPIKDSVPSHCVPVVTRALILSQRYPQDWLALPKTFQVLHCRIIELNQSRSRVFLQVLDLRSSGNRKHYRRFPKQPRKRELRWLGVEALRCPRQWTLMFREFAGSERKPGDKAEVLPGAIFQHVLGISIDQVVPVLDRNNRRDAPDCFDLLYADFRQSDVANLALALKIDECADLIFHRDFRVDPVQL